MSVEDELAVPETVWRTPIPAEGREGAPAPAFWLFGAHGGAGVSTLTRVMLPAGDCMRRWPSGHSSESPLVVIVSRTHGAGLSAAHRQIARYHPQGAVPARLVFAGLITIPDAPGKLPPEMRHHLALVADAARKAGGEHWHLPWIEEWRTCPREDLPRWHPRDRPMVGRSRIASDHGAQPPLEVIEAGQALIRRASDVIAQNTLSTERNVS
ncbi:DUF6668 family protein [Hoyosella altamirensis]|uniref:Uncharacterized protein n=1 Tax=Hoyosella altamirensis TaxID=616997 RepID=A0A839RVP1_9ACTN|nr:DUF6668 family protein [Hoyosella altamirensis]MBB3040084.1 hypothetical protein [Hoyosella altamirensis]